MSAIVEVRELRKYFPVYGGLFRRAGGYVRAVDGVSLTVNEREVVGLVGESGCGKTTVARCVLRLLEPTSGSVFFEGRDVTNLSEEELRPIRRRIQIVFQDPLSSLNPAKTVGQTLRMPLELHGVDGEVDRTLRELLVDVGLSPAELFLDRYPHQLSGGQRQRVGIARALATRPRFIVADEPVSSLDLSVRAQVLKLLRRLHREQGIAMLFITHDLAVLRSVASKVAVMYLGRIVEMAPVEELYSNPLHPYTKALLASVPVPDPYRSHRGSFTPLRGEPQSPQNPPEGCRFAPRCPVALASCSEAEPALVKVGEDHYVACPLACG